MLVATSSSTIRYRALYKTIASCFVFILTICSATGQGNSMLAPAALNSLIGCWQGTLNYSGTIIRKPYSTKADLAVNQLAKQVGFRFVHSYTKDTSDRTFDTLTISGEGKKLNGATIKSKHTNNAGVTEIVTEVAGFDRDNNKAAIIRHTYTISKTTYNYKRQVQLEGQTDWLDREEFIYARKPCKESKAKSCKKNT